MGRYKGSRFLIDKIDERLGSVDKEIEFDKFMIKLSLVLIIVCIGLIVLSVFQIFTGKAAIVGLILGVLLSFFFFLFRNMMISELKADLEKARLMHSEESSE